jgi:hypothetical protein
VEIVNVYRLVVVSILLALFEMCLFICYFTVINVVATKKSLLIRRARAKVHSDRQQGQRNGINYANRLLLLSLQIYIYCC